MRASPGGAGAGFDVQDAIALLRLEDLYVESFEIKDVKVRGRGRRLCQDAQLVLHCLWWRRRCGAERGGDSEMLSVDARGGLHQLEATCASRYRWVQA
jgi:hypothetical protein